VADAHYSFAIIGVGPAGSTCANALLLGGAKSVVLIDKARFPRDKACGDGIGPGAISILNELDLGEVLSAHRRVTLMSIHGPYGGSLLLETASLHRQSPLGYVIPRLTFDHAILSAALRRGGADMTGWGLENAVFDDQSWRLMLSNAETGETRAVSADVLIGADGATSKVRRILGQRLNRDANSSVAVRVYARTDPAFPAQQQLDVVEEVPRPGFGWFFATGAGAVNVGVGLELSAYKSQKHHLNSFLSAYRNRLGAPFVYDEQSCRTSILPFATEMPRLAFPALRAALIGDSASMINPLTGEGIFYGMYAGLQLGKRLAAAEGRASDVALAQYERDFRRKFSRHFRGNWYMRKLLEKPILMERMIAACQKDRDLCCDYVEYWMGNESGASPKPFYRLALGAALA
jgi:geranylgeranyl reductase family protein